MFTTFLLEHDVYSLFVYWYYNIFYAFFEWLTHALRA